MLADRAVKTVRIEDEVGLELGGFDLPEIEFDLPWIEFDIPEIAFDLDLVISQASQSQAELMSALAPERD